MIKIVGIIDDITQIDCLNLYLEQEKAGEKNNIKVIF
jgi:hypothetical protein